MDKTASASTGSGEGAGAPAPAPARPVADRLYEMTAARATVTPQGLLLEGLSPIAGFVASTPRRHAGACFCLPHLSFL